MKSPTIIFLALVSLVGLAATVSRPSAGSSLGDVIKITDFATTETLTIGSDIPRADLVGAIFSFEDGSATADVDVQVVDGATTNEVFATSGAEAGATFRWSEVAGGIPLPDGGSVVVNCSITNQATVYLTVRKRHN